MNPEFYSLETIVRMHLAACPWAQVNDAFFYALAVENNQ